MTNKLPQPKLFWLSDSPTTVTGYATITRNILNGLTKKGFECHQLSHNLFSQTIKPPITFEDGTTVDYTVHGSGREQYCKDILTPTIKKHQPELFGILLDTFMLYPWLIETDLAPARTLFYFPSDGGAGLPADCDKILRRVMMPVAMSRFAQQQAKELHGIKTEYIPHAVDTNVYYPLSEIERNKLRKEMRVVTVSDQVVQGALENKFVIGTVARNQGRKMLDKMLKAFYLLCQENKDAVLLCHTDPYDAAAVFDMRRLIVRYNLQNRVFFTGMRFYNGFDYKQMNEVYNVMDVFFLSTSGEGFGVPTIEAMACEVPVAVTDYTTTPELVVQDGQCGEPIALAGTEELSMSEMLSDGVKLHDIDNKLIDGTLTGSWAVERALMSVPDGARKLQKLYKDPALRKQYGKVGREKVLRLYSWDVVVPQWDSLLRKMLE